MIVEGRDSVVGIATRYLLHATGCKAGRGKKFSFLHPHPDSSWDPPSLLYNAFGALSWVVSGLGVALTTQPDPAPSLGMSRAMALLPLCAFMACRHGETIIIIIITLLLYYHHNYHRRSHYHHHCHYRPHSSLHSSLAGY